MNDLLLRLRQGNAEADAKRIMDALGPLPEEGLTPPLRFLKGTACEGLGLLEDANRLLLGLYEDDSAVTPYWEWVNDFRLRHWKELRDDRPKAVMLGFGGRIGLSLAASADTFFLGQGTTLAGIKESGATFRLNEDTFLDALTTLPRGWEPDFILIFTSEIFELPTGIEDSPYPVVGLPGDPYKLNKLAADVLFYDAVMPAMKHYVPAFEGFGGTKVLYAACSGIQGYIPWALDKVPTGVAGEKDYDVVFTGSTSSPFYRKRSGYLWRLLELAGRRKVFVGFMEDPQDFYSLTARTKIVVHCPSMQGGVNLRPFEAIGLGALVLHEEGDRSIEEFFEPGTEIVLFNEENFEEVLEYYLEHDAEREAIVARAMERNRRECGVRMHMRKVVGELSRVAFDPGRRAAARLCPAARWNAMGISSFYAEDFGRAAVFFAKALKAAGESGTYTNNLAAALMALATASGAVNPETERMLLLANRDDRATLISRFNLITFYRLISPDHRKCLSRAGEFVRELRNGSREYPPFTGDEVFFCLDGSNFFTESYIFRLEMEFALLDFPERGPRYQERIRNAVLWRVIEYTGDIYRLTEQLPGAIGAYELALRTEPRNELILGKLGGLYMEMNLMDKAKRCLEALLKLSPLHEDAHMDLTRVEMALGLEREAIPRLSRLLRFHGLKRRDELQALPAASERTPHGAETANRGDILRPTR